MGGQLAEGTETRTKARPFLAVVGLNPQHLSEARAASIRDWNNSAVHADLAHRLISNARIQVFQRPIVKFYGGLVVESDARLRHRRSNAPHDSYEPAARYRKSITGEFAYGGQFTPHFGHFMSECIHRVLPSKLLHHPVPWLFVTSANDPRFTSFETLPGFARQVFAFLGIEPGEFRIIAENSIVDRLFVAEQGSELGLGPKPGYLDDLHAYTTPRLDALHGSETRPSKVYVSRRGVWGGNFLGEDYLEDQLQAEGFAIVQPESLAFTAQMDLYRKAEVLVFSEGSACHGTELLGSGALRRCYLLARRSAYMHLDRVLQPRAVEFARNAGHPYVGTILMDRFSGQPLKARGVTLFNTKRLLAFFRDHGIARLANFDEQQYLKEAESHLKRYCDSAVPKGNIVCSGEELAGLFKAFDAVKTRIRA